MVTWNLKHGTWNRQPAFSVSSSQLLVAVMVMEYGNMEPQTWNLKPATRNPQ
jgi:hypothetical protein